MNSSHGQETLQPSKSLLKNEPYQTLYKVFLLVLLIGFNLNLLDAQQNKSSTHSENTTELTLQEKAWLKAHPNITLGYTDALEPDVIRNADGSYSGMVVDFLSLLNQKLGTNINLSISPIPEALDNVQKKNIDGIFIYILNIAIAWICHL